MQKSTATQLVFSSLGRVQVIGGFSGGDLSSDGGVMLIREVDRIRNLTVRIAECFTDHRNPNSVAHSVLGMLRQRIYGLCQGYEDLNDHQHLRRDPALLLALEQTSGDPLASAPTLNRLELAVPAEAAGDRYRKIAANLDALADLPVDMFIEEHPDPPAEIVLDVDATDIELSGAQQLGLFHGYYDSYVYLPLYVFCGEHLLACQLRSAHRAPGSNVLLYLEPVIARIRAAWPDTRIILRGDAGFARDQLMDWCEHMGVY